MPPYLRSTQQGSRAKPPVVRHKNAFQVHPLGASYSQDSAHGCWMAVERLHARPAMRHCGCQEPACLPAEQNCAACQAVLTLRLNAASWSYSHQSGNAPRDMTRTQVSWHASMLWHVTVCAAGKHAGALLLTSPACAPQSPSTQSCTAAASERRF